MRTLAALMIAMLLLPASAATAKRKRVESPKSSAAQSSVTMIGVGVGLASTPAPSLITALTNANPRIVVTIGGRPGIGTDGSTTLRWEASRDQSVVGYRIYYGVVSGKYTNSAAVGNVLTARVAGQREGQGYFYAATAYDEDGVESVFSNEASNIVPFRIYGPVPVAYELGSYGKNGVTNWFEFSTNGTTWRSFGSPFRGDGSNYRTATFFVTNAPTGVAQFRIR